MTTSRKPYLIRAMYEWICDNDFTPHVVIDAEMEGVTVPQEHVADGKIILNIGSRATEALQLGNEIISFATRFDGTVHAIQVPCNALLGIYARETGEGMIFTDEVDEAGESDKGSSDDGKPKPGKPTLKVVK